MTKQKSVLLLGSFGHTNLGDDLLMWNYLEYLTSLGYKKIYVNVGNPQLVPEPIRKKYAGLQMIETYKTSMVTFMRIIREADCVVYGGGTVYKELYASTGRSKYSVIQRIMVLNTLARLLGTRIYNLHIGIGSLKTSLGRFITKRCLAPATLSLLRDHQSYLFARDTLALPVSKLCDTTDGLFLNRIWCQPWNNAPLPPAAKKAKRVVGINVLSDIPDWIDRAEYIKTIRNFVSGRLREGSYVVLVPFQHDYNPRNDRVFMHEALDDILAAHPNHYFAEQVTIDTVSSLLRQCDVFVGMRFHSLLLSTVNNVPFVGIAYDTKCWRFLQQAQYTHAVRLESLTADGLEQAFAAAYKERSKIITNLKNLAEAQYKEASQCMQRVHL